MADMVLDMNLPSPSGPEDGGDKKQIIPERDGPQPATEETLSGISETVQLLIKCCGKSAPAMDAVKENLEQIAKNSTTAGKMAAQEPNSPDGKGKKKINEYFLKRMVGADLLTKMGGYLKQIAAGGLNLLKALLLLAMLGPDMLDGIIDLLVNVGMMLLNAFVRAIPVVVDAIAKWLPKIIDLLKEMIPKILDALINAFNSLANNETIPAPIRFFFKALAMLGEVLKFLSENLDILLVLLLAYVEIQIAIAVVSAITAVTKTAEAAAYWSMLLPVLLVIAAIALIVIGFILLYKHAEEVVAWFESLWDQFKNLSIGMKILIGVLALIFFPITILIALIYGIAKAFAWIKSGGATKAWEAFKLWIPKALQWIVDKFKALIEWFKNLPNMLLEGLKSIGTSIKDALKNALTGIIDSIFGPGAGDKVFDFFADAFKKLKDWAKTIPGLNLLFSDEEPKKEPVLEEGVRNAFEQSLLAENKNFADEDLAKNVSLALQSGDKAKIEEQIKYVQESNVDPKEKADLIKFLKNSEEWIAQGKDMTGLLGQMVALNKVKGNPAMFLQDAAKINLR